MSSEAQKHQLPKPTTNTGTLSSSSSSSYYTFTSSSYTFTSSSYTFTSSSTYSPPPPLTYLSLKTTQTQTSGRSEQ